MSLKGDSRSAVLSPEGGQVSASGLEHQSWAERGGLGEGRLSLKRSPGSLSAGP